VQVQALLQQLLKEQEEQQRALQLRMLGQDLTRDMASSSAQGSLLREQLLQGFSACTHPS
jgi:hypothetical protein